MEHGGADTIMNEDEIDEDDMAFRNLRRSGRAKNSRLPSLSSSSSHSMDFCEVVLTEVKSEETEDRIEMDFDGFDLLCLICGNYISSSCLGRNGSSRTEDEEGPANEKSTILTEFIKELELGVHEERISDLFGLFEERTNSPVCWSCFSKIRSAVEKKRRRDEMEVVVRDLQEKLLEKLHLLDGFVDQYYLEMESIAKFVRNSTRSLANMDGKISEFRRHILKVVDDLHKFQKGLRKKLSSLPILDVRGNEQGYGGAGYNSDSNDFDPEPDVEVQYILPEEIFDEPEGNASNLEVELGEKIESHKARDREKSVDDQKTKKRDRKPAGVYNEKKRRTDDKFIISLDTIESSMKDEIPKNCSFLKKHFILRAYQSEQNEKEIRIRAEDPLESNEKRDLEPVIHPVKYNSETAKISVGDVELIFPKNKSKSVQCSSCDFEAKTTFKLTRTTAGKLEREIISHIHYAHFHSFDCKLCPSKLPHRNRYIDHMKRCHGAPVKCKICEKPLKKIETVVEHEWTHKNEEERAEAERNGATVPKRFQKETIESSKLSAKDRIPCKICGRQIRKSGIKQHNIRIHSDNRARVMCPVCGKSLLKDTYEFHHKHYVCPLPGTGMAQGMTQLGEQHRIKCLHCPTTFKAKRFLKIHIARTHSEEAQKRSFLCSVCGKGYKSQGDLQLHMRIHQEERSWKCKWDCGRDFNVKRNCARHEKTCVKMKI